MVLNIVFLLKKLDALKQGTAIGVVIACGLQIWYTLDYCYCEEQWLYSFEYQRAGAGFQSIVGYAGWPFLTAVISKFVLDYK